MKNSDEFSSFYKAIQEYPRVVRIEQLTFQSYSEISSQWIAKVAFLVRDYGVKSLDFHFTDIDTTEYDSLLSAIAQPNTQLEMLTFDTMQFKSQKSIVKLFESLAKANSKIFRLELGCVGITDETMLEISEFIPKLTGLTALFLPFNQISNDGFSALTNAIATSSSALAVLNLNFNKIGNEGILYFVEHMKNSNKSLLSLHLAANNLSDNALMAFSILFQFPKHYSFNLSTLQLSKNKLIKENELLHLLDAISNCDVSSGLCELDLLQIDGIPNFSDETVAKIHSVGKSKGIKIHYTNRRGIFLEVE